MCTEMDSSQGPLFLSLFPNGLFFCAIKSWNEQEKKKKSNCLQDNSDNNVLHNVIADEYAPTDE